MKAGEIENDSDTNGENATSGGGGEQTVLGVIGPEGDDSESSQDSVHLYDSYNKSSSDGPVSESSESEITTEDGKSEADVVDDQKVSIQGLYTILEENEDLRVSVSSETDSDLEEQQSIEQSPSFQELLALPQSPRVYLPPPVAKPKASGVSGRPIGARLARVMKVTGRGSEVHKMKFDPEVSEPRFEVAEDSREPGFQSTKLLDEQTNERGKSRKMGSSGKKKSQKVTKQMNKISSASSVRIERRDDSSNDDNNNYAECLNDAAEGIPALGDALSEDGFPDDSASPISRDKQTCSETLMIGRSNARSNRSGKPKGIDGDVVEGKFASSLAIDKEQRKTSPLVVIPHYASSSQDATKRTRETQGWAAVRDTRRGQNDDSISSLDEIDRMASKPPGETTRSLPHPDTVMGREDNYDEGPPSKRQRTSQQSTAIVRPSGVTTVSSTPLRPGSGDVDDAGGTGNAQESSARPPTPKITKETSLRRRKASSKATAAKINMTNRRTLSSKDVDVVDETQTMETFAVVDETSQSPIERQESIRIEPGRKLRKKILVYRDEEVDATAEEVTHEKQLLPTSADLRGSKSSSSSSSFSPYPSPSPVMPRQITRSTKRYVARRAK